MSSWLERGPNVTMSDSESVDPLAAALVEAGLAVQQIGRDIDGMWRACGRNELNMVSMLSIKTFDSSNNPRNLRISPRTVL